ncbi:ribonuclease P protein subunit [Candidatus Bathyarchaeota archaeon]|nr:MAG: ribonuclease P protein subunit [Candidatus Bathyarchaeota archaeon]
MTPIEPRNLLRHELIGLEAEVVGSTNPCSRGIRGRVVDETRNTLVIEDGGRDKVVVKETSTFRFTLPSGVVVEVEGKYLVGRPEDRVKRRVRKLW